VVTEHSSIVRGGESGAGVGLSGAFRALEMGRFVEALQRFERRVDRRGDSPVVYREIGRIHHQFGRFDQAFDAYWRDRKSVV